MLFITPTFYSPSDPLRKIRYSIIGNRVKRLKRELTSAPERIVPWIGAGISAAAGLPLWSELLSKISQNLRKADRQIAAKLISAGFLDLAADLVSTFPEVNIEREMVSIFGRPVPGYSIPPQIRKLGAQTIVTTNYDRLIELAMPWLVPLTPQSYRSEAYREKLCLLKLHGTIERPESWIITRWQYARHYNADLIEDLRNLFRNKSILFLGCSLRKEQYLEILKKIPQNERGQHFAVLCVNSDAEGKKRGKALLELGIEVIPYRTMGGHSFVQEVLEYVQPSAAQTMSRVRTALDNRNTDLAVALLTPWLEGSKGAPSARIIADTTAYAVERLRLNQDQINSKLLIQLAGAATELDPSSTYALNTYAEILESCGVNNPSERSRLADLLNKESAEAIRFWSRTDNKAISDAYAAYRNCDAKRFKPSMRALQENPRSNIDNASDRLSVFEIRFQLSGLRPSTSPSDLRKQIPKLSGQISPFVDALIAYHAGDYGLAINFLDTLDRRWRAASSGTGLGFSLQLRAMCCLALGEHKQALNAIDRCHIAYLNPQRRLLRKFANGKLIPGELSYDLRALGSPELYALVDFWRLLAEINVRPNEVKTSRIDRVYQCLSEASEGDRLLSM